MSWAEPRRRGAAGLLAIALPLLLSSLAGCGFHPLYGASEPAGFDEAFAAIRVDPISDRMGQILANTLRDSFNPTGAKVDQRYSLHVTLYSSRGDLAIRPDGTASRELFTVTAAFILYAAGAGTPVFTGTARAVNSYELGESPYSVVVANDDAQVRAVREITQEVRSQLAFFLRRKATES